MWKKIALIFCLLLFAGWRYSGAKEVEIQDYRDGILYMTNNSEWLVYEQDQYRAEKWEKEDKVKLIYSKGFYFFDFLALNVTRADCVHVRAINDGK